MRSLIKTSILALYMAIALLSFSNKALAQAEVKSPAEFEVLKGEYTRTKAKGLYKAYCLKNTVVDFTKIESEGQIVTIVSLTGRILMPLANLNKNFTSPEKCVAQQKARLLENKNGHEISIEEITFEGCEKRQTLTRRVLEYNKLTKKISFKSTENKKLKIACEWVKI